MDFDALPPSQRNSMWLCLMHPRMRDFYLDRERMVREGIAHLRAAWAAHPDDPALGGLIAEFTAGNEDFARLWSEHREQVGPGPLDGTVTPDRIHAVSPTRRRLPPEHGRSPASSPLC